MKSVNYRYLKIENLLVKNNNKLSISSHKPFHPILASPVNFKSQFDFIFFMFFIYIMKSKETKRITFGNRQNYDNITYLIGHTGINNSKSLQTKPYWNGKLVIGRFIENYEGKQIIFNNIQNNDSFSRKHAEISLKRATKKYYVSKRFINFLLCLNKKESYLNLDVIKVIYSFYKKPKEYKLDSGVILENYTLVRDLGSLQGTKVRISYSNLHKNSTYMLSEDYLFVEDVQNEGIMYEDGRFFRNIPKDYISIFSPDYRGNYYEDSTQVYDDENAKCGFPHVQIKFLGIKYFLIATQGKFSFLIGRDDTCDIVLQKNNFSRVQAVIEYDRENLKWVIRDGFPRENKSSMNGTYKVLKSVDQVDEWVAVEKNEIVINDMKIILT